MLSIRNISIRNKLVLMQVFTSLIVLGIVFMAFIVTDIRDYKERKVNSVFILAHVIGTNCISSFDFQDQESAKQILAELKNVAPEVVHAWITDRNGKLFAGYTRNEKESLPPPHVINDSRSEMSGQSLFVTDDIVNVTQLVGKVTLEVQLSELQAIKKARYEMSAILIAVAVFLSFLIAFMVQPYISKRLLYLVNTMKTARRTGNYDTSVTDDGKDEISTLSQVFNKLMKQVTENQQKKDEFIGIASHELKTPLTSIKGYLDLLEATEDRQPNKLFVQRALESMHKMESLIRDLLDVSKIQSGQLQLNLVSSNVDKLINESIASLQVLNTTHTITMENKLNGEMVMVDPQRIEQVLINLLSNAIKYSPGEHSVIISTKKTDTELIVKIRDYGIGIPQDEMPDIFERFYRTKNSSVHISGFGLGLYICRDIVNRHKGRIWAERELKGTSFYFSLPL